MPFRGLSDELLKKKNIVYNPGRYCWSIPIYNEYGQSVGTVDHRPDAELKYIYKVKEDYKRPVLYNAQILRKVFYNKEPIFITEGIFDALSVEELGFKAVSVLGAKLNKKQVEILSRYTQKLILFFDSDTAGQISADRILKKYKRSVQLFNFKTSLGKDGNAAIQSNKDDFKQECQRIYKEVMEL